MQGINATLARGKAMQKLSKSQMYDLLTPVVPGGDLTLGNLMESEDLSYEDAVSVMVKYRKEFQDVLDNPKAGPGTLPSGKASLNKRNAEPEEGDLATQKKVKALAASASPEDSPKPAKKKKGQNPPAANPKKEKPLKMSSGSTKSASSGLIRDVKASTEHEASFAEEQNAGNPEEKHEQNTSTHKADQPAPPKKNGKRKMVPVEEEVEEEGGDDEGSEAKEGELTTTLKRRNAHETLEEPEDEEWGEGEVDYDEEFYAEWEEAFGAPYPYKVKEEDGAAWDLQGPEVACDAEKKASEESVLIGGDLPEEPPTKKRRLTFKQEAKEFTAPLSELPPPEEYSQDRQPDPLMSGWWLPCKLWVGVSGILCGSPNMT